MTHHRFTLPITLSVCLTAFADSHLEEVTVTGSQLEESIPLTLQEYGNQVEIVTAESILKHNFVDVTEALKTLVPGLHLSPKNGPFDYFSASLQGARSQDILWLVDGVRITNRLYNGTSPLDTIPPHMVERVEVLKGGQGIFYGTQSVSGVINIVTKSFSDTADGALGTGVNSNDGYNLNAYARGAAGDHQYVVYASKDYADGYTPFDKGAIQPSATNTERGYDVRTGGLKYAWHLSDNTRLSAQYQHTEAELDFARPNLNRHTVNARQETLATVKLDTRLSDAVQLFVKAYQHRWDTDYTRIYNELDNGRLTGRAEVINDNTHWGYKDYGFNTMAEVDFSGTLEYVIGFDQQNYSAKDDVWRIADQTERVNAAFVQVRTSEVLFTNTLLAFGLRNNRPSGSADSTVWNVSGKHEFANGWYVQGNLGTSFRLPDAEALFLNEYDDFNNDGTPDGGWFAIGNPELEAEESQNLNLSLGARWERLQFELTGFKRDVSHYISAAVPITLNGVTGETFANSNDEVNINGVELQSQWHLTDSVSGRFSYTYTRARFNDGDKQLNNIPERIAKLGLSYQPPGSAWGVNLSANYVGAINDRETRDSYSVANISGFYFLGPQQAHKLSLRLENITDTRYATAIGTAIEDRSGNSYLYRNLGMKRTLHLGYRYQF